MPILLKNIFSRHMSTIIKKIKVQAKNYCFRTQKNVGKVGLLLVGLGGNNGSTLLGGIVANRDKITWQTKKGLQSPNFYGSLTQCSTMKVAQTHSHEIFSPLTQILPLLDPTQLVIHGWDISSCNLADCLSRSQVFDYTLQQSLAPTLRQYIPMKSIYYSSFIASNQSQRADNVLPGDNVNKYQHLKQIRKDIRQFRERECVDKVIVLWTANTERCAILGPMHDSYQLFIQAIKQDYGQISPSMIFGLAAMLEDCVFINGSPQNTIIPALEQVPGSKGILIGNDFKTGQTKFKTLFIDFLVNAGIKPKSCVSYNHLGNNDGKNLAQQSQFKSKQSSKSQCVKDILQHSQFFKNGQKFDHSVVIKYVPSTGDSKKAIDEYVSQIFMGGQHTFVSYNICEDSLLAVGVMIDLIVLSELFTRVQYRKQGQGEYKGMSGVLPFLGYLMKAPQIGSMGRLGEEGKGPIINSLSRQRQAIENMIRVLVGLPLEDHLLLNYRL